jgi:uncharacterized protein YfaT (DUF1175 family)
MAEIEMAKIKLNSYLLLSLFFCLGMASQKNVLSPDESKVFRAWFVRIIAQQFIGGPTPRWTNRDCAGLVRFAANEAFETHDTKWLKANGIEPGNLPPDVNLFKKNKSIKNNWSQIRELPDSPYATAITIIQANSKYISKNINDALPGDLIFYDQRADQHLMIWMGSYIAYHTGRNSERETGLRAVKLNDLKNWKDSRWRLTEENPNFIGIFRFSFLSY